MASGEEAPAEPLKYQTWVLKVSIHCEGCMRKVKKVLQSIDGVYTTVVDMQQQRATVTGNVDPDLLVKKLLRTGKHAELLPQKPVKPQPNKDNNGTESKGRENKSPTKPTNVSDKKDMKPTKPDPPPSSKLNGKDPKQSEEEKDEEKQPNANDKEGEVKSGGSNRKKMKDKNGSPNPNEDNGNGTGAEAPKAEAAPAAKVPSPAHGLMQQIYQQFPVYHPQPLYAVSYNMAQPAAAYGYYTVPPPETAFRGYLQCPTDGLRLPPTGNASYDVFFSDENANACSLM